MVLQILSPRGGVDNDVRRNRIHHRQWPLSTNGELIEELLNEIIVKVKS